MRTVTKRIDKLEDRFGIAAAQRPCKVWVVRLFGRELALNDDKCVEILRECGLLPDGRRFAVVYLCDIPDRLNVKELERFLRENGEKLCRSARRGASNEMHRKLSPRLKCSGLWKTLPIMKSILSGVLRRKDGMERWNGGAGALRIEFIERSRPRIRQGNCFYGY